MGRELKRVPLDFDWPLHQPWSGFLNPHYSAANRCAACGGLGESPFAKALKDKWYGYTPFKPEDRGSKPFLPDHPAILQLAKRNYPHGPSELIKREAGRLCVHFNKSWSHHLNEADVAALLAEDRLWDLTHVIDPGSGKRVPTNTTPTPDEVNAWSVCGFLGHDSINAWVCIKAECQRLGEPSMCDRCGGSGEFWPSEEAKLACEAWERTEPPIGPGFQMWETVTEGSPISPVFETPQDLATYLAENPMGADNGTSFEAWMRLILGDGWAPSMVLDSNGIRTGVEALSTS